jgi:type IV pilus assembly protein PilX
MRYVARRAQRGVVLFVSLILLLVLTLLGISLARMQTVEERLAQNDFNHQLALQSAEAALQAAYDNDADGTYTSDRFAGGELPLAQILKEVSDNTDTTLAYHADWSNPGVDTFVYAGNGAPLTSAPAASQPQYVLEAMTPVAPPGCPLGPPSSSQFTHRITAHAAGGDGTASATVQIIHYGSC